MRITGLLATVLLAGALLPAMAIAQSSPADLAYCNRLADSYYRYIGRSESSPIDDVRRGSLDTQVAAAQCREGKTAQAIPVLERVLRNNGFTLPPRG
ncbi:hypothetical protein BH10PSE6_BH10PSE6_32980 [soil metagenome]